MARASQIDKRIAELESEIALRQNAINVLRSVQQPKPAAKPRKGKAAAAAQE